MPNSQKSIHKPRSSVTYCFFVNNKTVKVCKTTFLNTFAISDSWIKTILKKTSKGPDVSPDKRGRHNKRANAISRETIDSIKEHINSFPRVESHYLRKYTRREYLEENLNIHQMYTLYKEWHTLNKFGDIKMATERQYYDTFNTEFNISFFRPKKDRCNVCCNFENAKFLKDQDSNLFRKIETRYNKHVIDKEKARSLKNQDKANFLKFSKGDWKNSVVACFDYEKVLSIPRSDTNAFYYKRKIGVCNFTLTDIGRNQTICYCYDETIAKKGPNEVGSFLLNYMEEQNKNNAINKFLFYSDNCGGQNRNRFVFALYVYASLRLENVEITHTFLECGHMQNEGDAVHALIERRGKNHDIFTPKSWYDIIRAAKRSEKTPYIVKEVTQDMVFNLKKIVFAPNWISNTEGAKVPWSKVKVIHTSHAKPGKLFYKLEFDSDYLEVDVMKNRPNLDFDLKTVKLDLAYKSQFKLSAAKYKDVMTLCKDLAIPKDYHEYYENLQVQTKEDDELENSATTEDLKDLDISEQRDELEIYLETGDLNNQLDLGSLENQTSKKNMEKPSKKRKQAEIVSTEKERKLKQRKEKIGASSKIDKKFPTKRKLNEKELSASNSKASSSNTSKKRQLRVIQNRKKS